MSQGEFQAANPYASFGSSIADAPASERADFIRKTYSHLTMAVFACAALVWAFFQTGLLDQFAPILLQNRMYMLVVFGGFMLVSWIADNWARSTTSVEKQYAGLVLYVAAEAVFLAPMLWAANQYSLEFSNGETVSILPAASLITLVMFGGLSAIAWFSGADFSFLRAGLSIAGIAAMGLILVSLIFPLNLGIWFSVAMIVFASAYILYDTSNVMHHYQPGQHVAASLSLFASVALLFWYVVRLLMAFAGRE